MKVNNYNGTGFWAVEEMLKRYEKYARHFGVTTMQDLRPLEYSKGDKRWVNPVMDKVIDGIEKGDPACAELGVEFIEEGASFPFGQILKSNTARALRRASLTEEQKERIRKRVVEMLCTGYLPREYRQYAKLGRKIGLGSWLSRVEREADMSNQWVLHYYNYFKEHAAH